jgi:hypothetical protein
MLALRGKERNDFTMPSLLPVPFPPFYIPATCLHTLLLITPLRNSPQYTLAHIFRHSKFRVIEV